MGLSVASNTEPEITLEPAVERSPTPEEVDAERRATALASLRDPALRDALRAQLAQMEQADCVAREKACAEELGRTIQALGEQYGCTIEVVVDPVARPMVSGKLEIAGRIHVASKPKG